ncbi:MAG TPA: alpha-L-fucosidase [Gemmatimonadaceae bacterium]|nr:alpha-L-fucosidase [Gemmatimonadaceae bacterium]
MGGRFETIADDRVSFARARGPLGGRSGLAGDGSVIEHRCNRRTFLSACAVAGAGLVAGFPLGSERVRPSPAQLAYQRRERALFLHFGVNTFTNQEWGTGDESPSVFNPTALDARQWARCARASGFRSMVLTAKHHDGFCLWPSALTDHSVRRSPWRGGAGDVVRDFTNACRAEGLGAGLYLSPWDRHEPSYGDSPRYNDFYVAQLTELLTRYGPIAEVWFDGANGEGPNGKLQTYDWDRFHRTVRRLQPHAVMFSDAGPDVRWIGNEHGVAGDPNWAMVDPRAVPFPGATGPAVDRMLQHGDAAGSVWRPGEADVSIRPGWFWHAAESANVKSADELVDLFFVSVGRNANLLLNVPPNRAGLLDDVDVSRLAAFSTKLASQFAGNLGAEARMSASSEASGHGARAVVDGDPDTWWSPRDGDRSPSVVAMFRGPGRIGVIEIQEAIQNGQRVAAYGVDALVGGTWQAISTGTTIGHRKLDRLSQLAAGGVRLRILSSLGAPQIATLAVWPGPGQP